MEAWKINTLNADDIYRIMQIILIKKGKIDILIISDRSYFSFQDIDLLDKLTKSSKYDTKYVFTQQVTL